MQNCKELVELLRQFPNIKFSVSTNGIRVSDFWVQAFVQQGRAIRFSINAATRQSYDRIVLHGDHDRVLENIRRTVSGRKGNAPSIRISAVMLKFNVSELALLVRLGRQLGVDAVEFIVDPLLSFADLPDRDVVVREIHAAHAAIQETGMKTEGLEVFARRFGLSAAGGTTPKAERACPVPFTQLLVDQLGNTRVCSSTWKTIGNTYRTAVTDILDGSSRKAFQEDVLAGGYKWCPPQCPGNPFPRKTALLRKYVTLATSDQSHIYGKVLRKFRKLRTMRTLK